MTARTVSARDLETLARAAHADIELPGPEGGWAVAVINGRSYRARVGAVLAERPPIGMPSYADDADVCGSEAGPWIGAGHICVCNREPGHPLDEDRPHGCECGAPWSCPDCPDADPIEGCAECGARSATTPRGNPVTHHPAHLDAVLSRAEVGALLMVGVVVLAVIAVAACVPPIYAAIVRRGR